MYSASEKLAIIRLVEDSELSIRRTLVEINVSRSSFYRWYRAYECEEFRFISVSGCTTVNHSEYYNYLTYKDIFTILSS